MYKEKCRASDVRKKLCKYYFRTLNIIFMHFNRKYFFYLPYECNTEKAYA